MASTPDQADASFFVAGNASHGLHSRCADRPHCGPGAPIPGCEKDRVAHYVADCRIHCRAAFRCWLHGASLQHRNSGLAGGNAAASGSLQQVRQGRADRHRCRRALSGGRAPVGKSRSGLLRKDSLSAVAQTCAICRRQDSCVSQRIRHAAHPCGFRGHVVAFARDVGNDYDGVRGRRISLHAGRAWRACWRSAWH